ncbi:LOW QUALITY PROTEIN: hypothetical protein YC2023_042452 [Brassica napus]
MMNRQLSAHMADIKGKRICYDHDDEPIHLTDENDSPTIKDYRMSLIGKILNPKTIRGRMLIDVDTRQPLTFTRKIASPGGEEVSIQIHYDKLFKHCSSCGMLTHEVAYCPMKFPVGKDRVERTGVFERLPTVATSREPLLRDQKPYDRYETYSRSDRYGKGSRRSISPQRKHRHDDGFMSDARAGYHRSEVYNESFSRKQGGKENRYSSSFSRRNNRYAPYQKQQAQTWRAKEKMEKRLGMEMINCEPYDHGMNLRQTDSPSPQRSADISMEDRSSRKKIASAIVTPSRQGRDENVTRRDRDTVFHISGNTIDADQKLTRDLEKLTTDLSGLVTGMVKPSVDILTSLNYKAFKFPYSIQVITLHTTTKLYPNNTSHNYSYVSSNKNRNIHFLLATTETSLILYEGNYNFIKPIYLSLNQNIHFLLAT